MGKELLATEYPQSRHATPGCSTTKGLKQYTRPVGSSASRRIVPPRNLFVDSGIGGCSMSAKPFKPSIFISETAICLASGFVCRPRAQMSRVVTWPLYSPCRISKATVTPSVPVEARTYSILVTAAG